MKGNWNGSQHLDLSQNQLDGEAVNISVKADLRSLQVLLFYQTIHLMSGQSFTAHERKMALAGTLDFANLILEWASHNSMLATAIEGQLAFSASSIVVCG